MLVVGVLKQDGKEQRCSGCTQRAQPEHRAWRIKTWYWPHKAGLHDSVAFEDTEYHRDEGDDKEYVYNTTHIVPDKPNGPAYNQDNSDYIQHISHKIWVVLDRLEQTGD